MKFFNLKMMAMIGAASVALLANSNTANAQATTTITTSFVTGSALSAANVSNFDFGSFVVNVGGTDQFNIVVPPVVAGTVAGTVTCVLPGSPDPSSVCSELSPPASAGVVSVTGPIASQEVQISGSVTTPFADAGLELIDLTYIDSAGTPNTGSLPLAFTPTAVVETNATPGDPESIGIGATLRIGGSAGGVTPAASTTSTDAVVTVNFQF